MTSVFDFRRVKWLVAFLLPLGVWAGYRQLDQKHAFFTVMRTTCGWGYRIYQHDQLLIEQVHIPAMEGHHCFTDSVQAAKVAQWATLKLDNGQLPTITQQELDSLIDPRTTP